MLCEHCKKREATVKYVEVINGVKTEHNLCTQCAAHGAPGGGVGALTVYVQQGPGRHNADNGVEALVHHLGDGCRDHGTGALSVAAHHAQKGEQERGGRQNAQRPGQTGGLIQSFQKIGAEKQQAERKCTHDKGKQQRHRQNPRGVTILAPGHAGRDDLGNRGGQTHG